MGEANPTGVVNSAEPPATNPHNSDKSAIIIICLTILIYAFFFLLRCPPFPFQEGRRRRRSGNSTGEQVEKSGNDDLAYASHVNYKKGESSDETEQGGGECPVCLSMYVDGEELRQLNVCKHTFHGFCINKWLAFHNNCPVCRASVRVNRSGLAAEDALRQVLPDSASIV